MTVELGTTDIVGRRDDFSLLTTRNTAIRGGPLMHEDILSRLIVVRDNVGQWISDNKARLDQQHEKNIAAIDSDMDLEIKAEGGLNVQMDSNTPNQTIIKEKNIVVKLYLAKQSEADDKSKRSKSLFGGYDVLASDSKIAGSFIQSSLARVYVKKDRLVDWANSYEAARLAQVYSEIARRLKEKEQFLANIEEAQAAQIAQAENQLMTAKELVDLKQYPVAPPEVSIDQNLQESKEQNEYFSTGGSAFLFSWFYKKVRNGGDWDYKQHGRQYESFGNFNYGAVGTAAGISEGILLRAAGAAQSVAGTSESAFDKWWSESPFGDDPVDQVWIKAGIEYAKSKGY